MSELYVCMRWVQWCGHLVEEVLVLCDAGQVQAVLVAPVQASRVLGHLLQLHKMVGTAPGGGGLHWIMLTNTSITCLFV